MYICFLCSVKSCLDFKVVFCVCVYVHVCDIVCGGLCSSQIFQSTTLCIIGIKLSCQAWQQVPLQADPFHWPTMKFKICLWACNYFFSVENVALKFSSIYSIRISSNSQKHNLFEKEKNQYCSAL